MTHRDAYEAESSEGVDDAPVQSGAPTSCGVVDCHLCELEQLVARGGRTWKRNVFLDRGGFRFSLAVSVAMVFVIALLVVEGPMRGPGDLIAIFFLLLFPTGTVTSFVLGWHRLLAERQRQRRLKALARSLRKEKGRARRGSVEAKDDALPVVLRTLSSRFGHDDEAPRRGAVVAALPFVIDCGGDAFLVDVPFVDVAESPSREDLLGTVALYPGDEVVVLFDEHEPAVAPAWFTAHKGIDYRRRAMRRIVATAERPVVVLVCERGTNCGA